MLNPPDQREIIRRTLDEKYHGAIPVTDAMIDAILDGLEQEAGRADRPPQTDAEWLYGDTPAGLRRRAAEELAAEFGTDVDEWLV